MIKYLTSVCFGFFVLIKIHSVSVAAPINLKCCPLEIQDDSVFIAQIPVPSSINSTVDESSPLTNASENILYFNRFLNGKNHIFSVRKIDEYWTNPKDISHYFGKGNNARIVDLSADGQTLLLSMKKGNNSDLYKSVLEGEIWTQPVLLKMFSSKYDENYASMSYDERTFYFSSNRPGGEGGYDIYVSLVKDDGSWTTPKNMGKAINSNEDDICPSIHTDGLTLYYASNRTGGLGGFDIYSANQQDEKWAVPTAFGNEINSPDDELGFRMSVTKRKAYWTRKGNDVNILMAEISRKSKVPSLVIYTGVVSLSDRKSPDIVEITISDAESKEVIGEYRPNARTGDYTYILPPDKTYNILLTAPGYLGYTHDFDVSRDSIYSVTKRSIKLEPIKFYNPPLKVKNGEKYVYVDDLLFELDNFTVIKYNKNLNKLADFLKENKTCVIEIGGFADAKGNSQYNQRLSRKRALEVAGYLLSKGVQRQSYVIRDYGQSRPIARNDSEDGQRFNRRVEFKVLKQGRNLLKVTPVLVPDRYMIEDSSGTDY